MAYQAGSADSENDLLNKLNAFLTGNSELVQAGENWKTVYSYSAEKTDSTGARQVYVWSAPGGAGAGTLFISAASNNDIKNDIYNVYFHGGIYLTPDIASGLNYQQAITACSPAVGLFGNSRSFKYWFFASGRRFVVITLIDSVYSSAYCGFILPLVTPDEYPYPLLIAGSIQDVLLRYSNASEQNSCIADPRDRNCWLLSPGQLWEDFYGAAIYSTTDSTRANRYASPAGMYRVYGTGYAFLATMGPSDGTGYPLYRVTFSTLSNATDWAAWGALDGVCWLPGVGSVAEDTITTPDGQQYIIFRNAWRTAQNVFFAVRVK